MNVNKTQLNSFLAGLFIHEPRTFCVLTSRAVNLSWSYHACNIINPLMPTNFSKIIYNFYSWIAEVF